MNYNRPNLQQRIRRLSETATATERLEDQIQIEADVICKCHIENDKLQIKADSYLDYTLAKSVAIKRFNFEPGNISYRNSGAT